MRVEGNAVYVSGLDIDCFAESWPCCDIPYSYKGVGVWFEFEENGDLADIRSRNRKLQAYDGPDMLALSEDAQRYWERYRRKRKKSAIVE